MRRVAVPLLLALALLAGGCTSGDRQPPADPPGTLRVLAGSELKDVEPLVGQIRDATGVNLRFEYSGTLEGAERITGGEGRPDLAWFSSARYLTLLAAAGDGEGRPVASERIMLSPVVLGVKRRSPPASAGPATPRSPGGTSPPRQGPASCATA